jgi:antitoxin HicB
MMNKKPKRPTLEYYLGLSYPIQIYPEMNGGYTVTIKDLPGCISQGETKEEALSMIEDARIGWLEVAYAHNDPIPEPQLEPEYSGKLLLRMPKSLHQRLAERASREGVSLNQYVNVLLGEANALHLR